MNWYIVPTIVVLSLYFFFLIHRAISDYCKQLAKSKLLVVSLITLVALGGIGLYSYANEVILSIDIAGQQGNDSRALNDILQQLRQK